MKRIIIAALAALLTVAPASAQIETRYGVLRPANEISVSNGQITALQLGYVLAVILGGAFSGGEAELDEFSSFGSFGLEYHHYLNRHIAVGANATYESCIMSIINSGDGIAYSKSDYLSLFPSVKLPWFYRSRFSMYSKVAAGPVLSYGGSDGEISRRFIFGWQAVPVGLDFGGRGLRGFVEMGGGLHGMVNYGLRFAF